MKRVLFTLMAISYCVWGYSQTSRDEDKQNIVYELYYTKGCAAAQNYGRDQILSRKNTGSYDDTTTANILNNLAIVCYYCGDYNLSIQYAKEALELRKKLLSNTHRDYLASMSLIGAIYYAQDMFDDANYWFSKALDKISTNNSLDTSLFISIVKDYCLNAVKSQQNKGEAMEYLKKCIKISTQSQSYRDALPDLSRRYALLLHNAITEDEIAYWDSLSVSLEKDKNYYEITRLLCVNCSQLSDSNIIPCEKVCKEAISLADKYGDSYEAFVTMVALSYFLGNEKDYLQRLAIDELALEYSKLNFGQYSREYITILQSVSIDYIELGEVDKAITALDTLIAIAIPQKIMDSTDIGKIYSTLSVMFSKKCHYGFALYFLEKAENFLSNEDKGPILIMLGEIYEFFDQKEKALKSYKQALELLQREHEFTVLGSLCISHILSLTHKKEQLIYLGHQIKTIYQGNSRIDEGLYEVANTTTRGLIRMNEYSEANDILISMKEYYEKSQDTINDGYLHVLLSLGDCNAMLSSTHNALYYYRRALKISIEMDGENSYTSYKISGRILILSGHDGSVLSEKDLTLWSGIYSFIQSSIYNLTPSERDAFLEDWSVFRESTNKLVWSCKGASFERVRETGMDLELLFKGLQLRTDISLKQNILQSGDSSLINALYHYNLSSSSNTTMQKKEELMHDILYNNHKIESHSQNKAILWKNIRDSLSKHEAAVEFVNFAEYDSLYYAAYVVRKGDKAPRWVPLDPWAKTEKLNDSTVYTSSTMSQWIWGKLAKELKGVKTVYFAPSGELYNIGIEYLPDYADSTRRIGDRWTLHRLSSTRELALNKEKYSRGSSAVYGGLQYNADKQVLQRDSKRYPSRHRDWSPFNIADTLASRGGADYLPGTRMEAVGIDSTLRTAHFDNLLFTDTLGTEASFKALDGQRRSLLHISTHGFYWTPEEADLRNDYIKTIDFGLGDGKVRYTEDKALTRSGLLMAGVNNALKGGIMPDSVDDGILTAKEIAELDLRGLDIVVLSACQTGLGDVSGEGVFGLQRGFKKAGAQSILMSLWKVDDRATQLLMTRFYHNWTSGMSKKKALTEAQEYLRNYTETRTEAEEATDNGLTLEDNRRHKTVTVKPYTSPHYWAAFILLDALD